MSDLSYPVHERAKQWAEQIIASKGNAAFDDSNSVWQHAPENVQALAEIINTTGTRYASGKQLIAATLDSACRDFEQMHGSKPSGAILDSAIRTTLNSLSSSYRTLAGLKVAAYDDVQGGMSGAPMQANRAALGIYNAITEAIPFAGVIPMSEGLQGKVIIAQHEAANTVGHYRANDSLDGINAGKPFMLATRDVQAEGSDLTNYTAKIKYAEGDANGSPVIPSGTDVFVNGLPAGGVPVNTSSSNATAPIVGSVVLNGTTHNVTGTLTTATGDVTLKFDPKLPTGSTVHVSGILNYEHPDMKGKRPRFQASARSYDFRATFTSGLYQVSQEAKAQFSAEVRLDPASEAMLAMRQQANAERHRTALNYMYRIGKNFIITANMNAQARQDERSRASMWSDLLFALTAADQNMIERTNAFGIGVIYVGGKGRAELEALPENLFQKAGSPSRPGIYRIGRLFNRYEVYYAPNLVNENATSIEMLAIGRSEQTGLNPLIIGDVVAPTFVYLGNTPDLLEGAGYFQAGALRVNPHAQAATGAAIIAITGL